MHEHKVLWTTASFQSVPHECPSLLQIPISAQRFALCFDRSRIILSKGAWELLCTLGTKSVHSEGQPCHSYSLPNALNPREVVSGSVSCAVVPKSRSGVRRGQTQDFPNVFQFPAFACWLKSVVVLPLDPAFCCSIDCRSPGIWGSVSHAHLALFLFKCKQHVKKTVLFLPDPNAAFQEEQHQTHTAYMFMPAERMSKSSFLQS